MSLSDLLTDYPKSWTNMYVNTLTTTDPAKGLFPYVRRVPTRLEPTANVTLNTTQVPNLPDTPGSIISKVGTRTFIHVPTFTIQNVLQKNGGGPILLEVDYEPPVDKQAAGAITFVMGAGNGAGTQITEALFLVPMANQAYVPPLPGNPPKTRFESLVNIPKSTGAFNKNIVQTVIVI